MARHDRAALVRVRVGSQAGRAVALGVAVRLGRAARGPSGSGDETGDRTGHGRADPQMAQIVADLRARLRPACPDWSDGDFDALVLLIARTKLRWGDSG